MDDYSVINDFDDEKKKVAIARVANCVGSTKVALASKILNGIPALQTILEERFGLSDEEHYYALNKVKQAHGEGVVACSSCICLLF